MMLMDDMLFSDGSEFRLGSIVPNLKFFVVPMVAVTLITFTVMSCAATRQVTISESMLMIFVAIHCEHAFGDGGTFAKVPPSPLPGKGALTHHLQAGGGSPPGTCALRGGFRPLRWATGNSASLIPCTNTPLLAKEQQRHFRVVTTCHWQLVGYDGMMRFIPVMTE